ncbi:hypothetical protein [Candidatus Mesenet endosymbiont of Phosphuga atrata]|uniref:hypothetical protein n=1 Tax=Candidatus Mesenet endosymbiont of Phosphuga atrata TaxID=3066221 RepID=UPI0030CEFF3F
MYGYIEEGYKDDNNIYLEFVDPLHQRTAYKAKPSRDDILLFSSKDENGNLLYLKLKKSRC